jgi:hypothetical protein
MYGFTLNRKRPGHFSLCFLANKNSTVQTWVRRISFTKAFSLIPRFSRCASLQKLTICSMPRPSEYQSFVMLSKSGKSTCSSCSSPPCSSTFTQTSSRVQEFRRCSRKNALCCWYAYASSHSGARNAWSDVSAPDRQNSKCLRRRHYPRQCGHGYPRLCPVRVPDTVSIPIPYTSVSSAATSDPSWYEPGSPRDDTKCWRMG